MVEVETVWPNSSSKASRCSSSVRSSLASRCFGSQLWSFAPFVEGLPGIGFGSTSPVSRRLLSQRLMVGTETEEGLCDPLPWHPTVHSGEHPQPQILRVQFHSQRLTPGSILTGAAVRPPRYGEGVLGLTWEQKKKLLKAKIAVALQNEPGRVPILGNQKLHCLGLKKGSEPQSFPEQPLPEALRALDL